MCGWCWDIFYSNGNNAKFCSSSCKDKNRYAENREQRLAAVQQYRKDNAELIRERARARYKEKPEYFRMHNQLGYARNRKRRIRDAVEYQKANPEVVALTRNRRKARQAFKISRRDHRRLLERYRHSCAYCEVKLAPWGREFPNSLQWDHVVPLSKGGSDGVGNILPSCRSCNGNKSARFLSDWKLNK